MIKEAGIFQTTYSLKVKMKLLSRARLFATPWTVVYQASPSMGFSSQEYWSGLPFPSPGDLPSQGIKPMSLHWQVDSLPLSHQGSPLIYSSMYMSITVSQFIPSSVTPWQP